MAKKSRKKAKKAKKSKKSQKAKKGWGLKLAIAIICIFVVIVVIVALSQTEEEEPEFRIPTISGGPGFTMETALIVDADDTSSGIAAEYAFLKDNACLGKGGPVERTLQVLLEGDEGHMYDMLEVLCADDSTENYYFQIDSFFGK